MAEEEQGPKRIQYKVARDFLYPKMLGGFVPSVIRKLPVEDLRNRYLQVYSASMGNHSLSMYYCDWKQAQFEAAMTDEFAERINQARSELADRATYIMHRGMGLIESDEDAVASPQVTAAMAKVVEGLNARKEQQTTGKGFKLVVEGLDRTVKPSEVK